jgi:leucyl aminopeptidase
MPIFQEHRDDIKGAICDLKNSGKTRYGGASTAAAFLEVRRARAVYFSILGLF